MAQQAPKTGQEKVAPSALVALREFAEDIRPDLEFALTETEQRLAARVEEGLAKYGTPLMTHNGRDALQDAWEEAADLIFYVEQATLELPQAERYRLQDIGDLGREALLLLTEQRVARENGIGS